MDYQSFWNFDRYAIVGNSAKKPFPKITYGKLKENGKEVFPVDETLSEIDGDSTLSSISVLPNDIEAIILEVPKEGSLEFVKQAFEKGIKNIWLHMNCDTPEAISFAKENGVNLWYGTCAVMYLTSGFSIHSFHGWINKKRGTY